MEITTLRLPEGLKEALEDEAEERDLSFAEYTRGILRNRDRIQENTEENTRENTEYDERIRDLEQRVSQLEEERGEARKAAVDEALIRHDRDDLEGEMDVDLEIPGSGETRRRREEAIYAMRDRLRELRRANKDDLVEVVDAEEVRYADEDSFWSNCVKGRDTLRALPGVEPPPEGNRTWRWVGE